MTSIVVAPSGAAGPRALAAKASGATAKAERLIRSCANRQRAKRVIPKLRPSRALGRAARAHARAMLRQGFFGHTDPRGRGPDDRVAALSTQRWSTVGENIAAGYATASETCVRWNKAHLANMLKRSYTHIGAGYARGPRGYGRYYVQVFGTLAR
ncbi:MAG: CAP domain-containing protein [Solirubrobacterales bacterium]